MVNLPDWMKKLDGDLSRAFGESLNVCTASYANSADKGKSQHKIETRFIGNAHTRAEVQEYISTWLRSMGLSSRRVQHVDLSQPTRKAA